MAPQRIGIVLFQLGGPDTLDAVEPFLHNLFCDPDIIQLPFGFLGNLPRRLLARYISKTRSPHVREAYSRMGGGSPIRLLTERQARALKKSLSTDDGKPNQSIEFHTAIAMRYWHPFTEEAIAELEKFSPTQLVLLPLYPHYSFATTASSLKEWERCLGKSPLRNVPSRTISEFHHLPGYIEAVVERINLSLSHFDSPEEPHLVFSAHGLPVSYIERGDSYQKQIQTSVQAVLQLGKWKNASTLCYQSKVGRQKWLEPSLLSTLRDLGSKRVRKILVVPISFVTEHIETLHEINEEAREVAVKAGVQQFEMMPALGDSPRFIETLAAEVRRVLGLPAKAISAPA
ncbi:MAG: ferrochelatase [Acidobacteria bacterium]|nr:ferrochelatase [Acidobacteriota bacterium]